MGFRRDESCLPRGLGSGGQEAGAAWWQAMQSRGGGPGAVLSVTARLRQGRKSQ